MENKAIISEPGLSYYTFEFTKLILWIFLHQMKDLEFRNIA